MPEPYKDIYKAFAFDPFSHPFNIELVGTTTCESVYVKTRSKSPDYIFEYIVEGSGTLIVDSQNYYPKTGDAYILHKGRTHTYYPNKNDLWIKIWFNVTGIFVEKLLEAYELCDTVIINDFNKKKLFEDMYNIANSDIDVNEILKKCEFKFHEILYAFHQTNSISKTQNKIAYKIKNILDNNIYSQINLKEIGNILFISTAQIIKIFKREYGKTPHEYLIEKRIITSTILLKSTNLSINQISDQLNFADQHYFSNVFKKNVGVSPLNYRKSFS
jgi:AraC family transcriptional regulator of arabinose operon